MTSALMYQGSRRPDAPSQRQLLELVSTLYHQGLTELQTIRSVEELLNAHGCVVGAQKVIGKFLRDRQVHLRARNQLAELVLRIERQIGQWLAENVNHLGGGDRRSRSRNVTADRDIPANITKNESSRWQRIAAISEEAFDLYLVNTQAAQKELTTAGLLKFADRMGYFPPDRQHHGAAMQDQATVAGKKAWSCSCTTIYVARSSFRALCLNCQREFMAKNG